MQRSIRLSLRNVYETLAVSVPTVVDAARGVLTIERTNTRLVRWSESIIRNAHMEVEVVGRENLPRSPYIAMSNHQSLYDIPVLYRALGSNLRMITKIELFELPVFGRALKDAGFIAIDRSDRTHAIESLRAAEATLARGMNIWIAPEGTRSPSGELLPFKKGGFHLALSTHLPVVPVSVRGTRDALPAKGARSSHGAHVKVTIFPSLSTADDAPASGRAGARALRDRREKLMHSVKEAIQSGL